MNLNRPNNFDLLRLIAATDIFLSHLSGFYVEGNFADNFIIDFIPGVPIFFFISGFLIFPSYENSIQKFKNYNINFFIKRFLRIHPAMIVCLLLTTFSILQSGYLNTITISAKQFFTWFATQITFLQIYKPDYWSDYGRGDINGSLWTVTLELQFYFLVPFIYLFIKKFKKFYFVVFIGIFLIGNICYNYFDTYNTNFLGKLYHYSFIPWIYMFLLGGFLSKEKKITDLIKKTPYFLAFLLAIFSYIFTKDLGWSNSINPVGFICLIPLILKSAYTLPNLSNKLLRGNDISYGIYIYHIPIFNYLHYQNFNDSKIILYGLITTILFAVISWVTIEKPSLNLKKTLNKFHLKT